MSRRPSSSPRRSASRPASSQPTWTEVTAGGWSDRFDIAYGSGAINATRMEHLYMTQPYYYVPQRFLVPKDSTGDEAVRSRWQEDRDVHELHGRVLPQGHAGDPRRRPRPEGQGSQARRLRDRETRARRPRRRADRCVPDGGAGRRTRRSRRASRSVFSTTPRSRCTRPGSSTRRRASRSRRSSTGSTRSSGPPTPTGRLKALSMQVVRSGLHDSRRPVRPRQDRPDRPVRDRDEHSRIDVHPITRS